MDEKGFIVFLNATLTHTAVMHGYKERIAYGDEHIAIFGHFLPISLIFL